MRDTVFSRCTLLLEGSLLFYIANIIPKPKQGPNVADENQGYMQYRNSIGSTRAPMGA